jgi:hypothetical protein
MPYQPAVLGTARLNNFRLNYLSAALQDIRDYRVLVYLDGVLERCRVRRGSVTIHDVLNDAPNTCTFSLDGAPAPEAGMQIRITINTNTPRLLFNGTLETTALTYEGKPANTVYSCSATDDTMRADNRRPFAFYQNVSASTVAADLVARFAPGLTAVHVQAGLPAVTVAFDGSEGFNGALRAIAKIIGAYFYWEDGDLHFFLEEPTSAPDHLTNTTCSLLLDPPIASTSDDSQVRTRVYGRGFGATLLSDVLAGETVLPLDNSRPFTAGGGSAIVSQTADGSPTDRIAYTIVVPGGVGTLVGPGVTPLVAPVPTAITGTGLGLGTYQYAYTFVTAAGESLPSPIGTVITTGGVANPVTAPTAVNIPNGAPGWGGQAPIGQQQQFTYAYSTNPSQIDYSAQTTVSPGSNIITTVSNGDSLNPTQSAPVRVTVPYSSDPRVKTIFVYEGNAASGGFRIVRGIANDHTTGNTVFDVTVNVTNAGQLAPTANTTPGAQAIALDSIALGPTPSTTARKVYRTAVNGAALKLQQTIANNTATVGVTDTTADGALGAAPPASDTSGLTQPSGSVLPGATSILTTGGPAAAGNGWMATTGGAVIRYTGVSGNTLVGIPASGPGAIVTALPYGVALVQTPMLAGVSGVTTPLAKGGRVHIFVQRDDPAAQASAAARESTATYAADGIHEHLIVDERRAEPSLVARCDADLQLFAYPLVTVQYVSHDVKTKSGKPIDVSLTSPPIDETLVIQDVTISALDVADGLPPRFATTASSVKFSLEDLLRRMSALLPE